MSRALLWVWLLALAAGAQEFTGNVTLNTSPPGVDVYEYVRPGFKPLGRSNEAHQWTGTDKMLVCLVYPPDRPDELDAQGQLAHPLVAVRMSEATKSGLYPQEPLSVSMSEAAQKQYRHDQLARIRPGASLVGCVVAVVAVGGYVRLLVPWRERRRRRALRDSRWQALRPLLDRSDPQVGRRLGAFRLSERLGGGGMAAVYRALPDETLDEDEAVAVKVMHPQTVTEEAERRFRQEAAVCARLNHPNLVRILDAGDQDGQLYLAMELVRGRTLRSELRAGGAPAARVRELFRPIFAGLQAAHEQGVVHRDLKPDNVMITDEGRLVVMDFGLARRQDLASITATGSVLGTPAYMAPEQVRGEETDARTDQYALGVMLYELLAGRLPFGEELDPLQLLMKHLTADPAPLEVGEPQLQAAVMKMLAKRPADRFPDLQAAGAQLF